MIMLLEKVLKVILFAIVLRGGNTNLLFLGIGGGGSSKFGIYWNEDTQSYKNQANKIIPISELEQRFNKLKKRSVSDY